MKFSDLTLTKKKSAIRAGRGISAGRGKTAGRGTKGQGARKSGGVRQDSKVVKCLCTKEFRN